MAAVASSGHDRDSSFVGQVFQKGSPILTWRPTRVLRVPTPVHTIELDMADIEEVPESTIQRVSRVPTRRVVAWPVVPNVERGKARSQAWSIAAHVTIALVLACGMALGIVALDVGGTGVARAAQPLRDGSAHVMEATVDMLANTPLEPPSVVAPAVAPMSSARKSASSHAAPRGRARPAPQAHPATHAAHRPAHNARNAR